MRLWFTVSHLQENSLGKPFKTGFSCCTSRHRTQRSVDDPQQLRLCSGKTSHCAAGSADMPWHCCGALLRSRKPNTRTSLKDGDGILCISPPTPMNCNSQWKTSYCVDEGKSKPILFLLHWYTTPSTPTEKAKVTYASKSLWLHYMKNFNLLLKVSVKLSLDGDVAGN